MPHGLPRPFLLLALTLAAPAFAQTAPAEPSLDFSYAGYRAAEDALPDVPAVLAVRPTGADDTALLQAAIDTIAARPPGPDGFRGALLFHPGVYQIAGQLRIRSSGIVLRGESGSTLRATGRTRRTLIVVGGAKAPVLADAVSVSADAPAGARALTLASVRGLKPGDRVVITRPSTAEWIAALGMNTAAGPFADQRIQWTPGSRDLVWDRTLVAIDPATAQVTLDAPITTALQARFGGGTLAQVAADEPLRQVGLENLLLQSDYDPARPFDEEHAWIALAFDHVEDAWARNLTVRHFAGSAIRVGQRARRLTLHLCRGESPVSEPGGYRRQTFYVEGQQVLVAQCQADSGMNDFASGLCAAGPNVFVDCLATHAIGFSGSCESWASGILYDNVRIEGAGLHLGDDMRHAQGAGWTAANSILWNCHAAELEARGPQDAPNVIQTGPGSLYRSLRARRLGPPPPDASRPAPIAADVPLFTPPAALPSTAPADRRGPLQIINGRYVVDGRALWGGEVNDAWWLGQVNPSTALNCGISITRFVPGRDGPGLTEDLSSLAARMAADGTPFFQSGPGLWYDRRRDEHSITERMDPYVWAPFYEMPWARSGQGKAWDGLSRFDLTRYNPWYFDRTREFADRCARHGLLLYHSMYNTHNVLEIGAHWADYPWRPACNINDTGLPEPPPLEPNNRLHVANQFYSIAYPPLRALHEAYIRHVLDELADQPNILFSTAYQFAGPLEFQRFFQDTVAEWEREHHRTVRLFLCTSKDITDAILDDPVRSKQVVAVDMRYWQIRPDGKLFAPAGGQNLAFREMIGKAFSRATDAAPATTPAMAYKQVRDYRDRYPRLAFIAWNNGVGQLPALMAGAAQVFTRNPTAGHGQGRTVDRTPVDAFLQQQVADFLMTLSPNDVLAGDQEQTWYLADDALRRVLVYSVAGPAIKLGSDLPAAYVGVWCDPRTGKTQPLMPPAAWTKGTAIAKPSQEEWLLLLTAKK